MIVSTAAAIASALLATILVVAAARKLSYRDDVVAEYARVGVPRERLGHLALILLAGAAGLLLGLAWSPVAIAAAAGTVVYFLLAIVAHIRHHDAAHLPIPATIDLIAITTLTLQLLD